MAFATKKAAQEWAQDYLAQADKPGLYIDPVRSGTVEIVKRGRYWSFPGGDSWIDDVEVRREQNAQAARNVPPAQSSWVDAAVNPSHDGDYECRIENNGREFIATRRYRKGHWFGGCRPFADADVVLAWKMKEPDPAGQAVESNDETTVNSEG
ncbi:hypothetical protein [Aeromonas caviae]|uniref:hypothetical protein n=1 Tax=Aeromonas caviae TaxID=648 RepID=UPI001CC56482|nr:hypothetical protein [Aeromonas caviae]GJA77605.1 hypothetical protein KAM354_28410 [Aeromonas caviae]HDT5889323.1 hypothetical protein [Aeromonas dhakensis]HEB4980362.1 hypothetical protein [Aeromonas dhakensis]